MFRFYLYSVTAVSLGVFYTGITGAVKALASVFLDTPYQVLDLPFDTLIPISTGFGFAVIALPVWFLHWRWLLRLSVGFDKDDLQFHQFYLFTVVCILVFFALVSGGEAMANLFRYWLGAGLDPLVQAKAFGGLLGLAITAALWLHHWFQFRGRFGDLTGLVKSINGGKRWPKRRRISEIILFEQLTRMNGWQPCCPGHIASHSFPLRKSEFNELQAKVDSVDTYLPFDFAHNLYGSDVFSGGPAHVHICRDI